MDTASAQQETRLRSFFSEKSLLEKDKLKNAGLNLGTFLLYPSITASETYNTNLYASHDNEESDFKTVVKPVALLESNWTNHALKVQAGGEIARYKKNKTDDYDHRYISGEGFVDLRRNLAFKGVMDYREMTQDATDADTVNGRDNPIRYNNFSMLTSVLYKPSNLFLEAGVGYSRRQYKNYISRLTGNLEVEEDRDTTTKQLFTNIGYEISPSFRPYVGLSYAQTEFDVPAYTSTGFNGAKRDFDLYSFLVGFDTYITDLLVGKFAVGLQRKERQDNSVRPENDLSIDGDLLWSLTPATTVSAELSRSIQDSASFGSSYVETLTRVGVTHELLHDITLNMTAGITGRDYDDVTRQETNYSGGLGISYALTPKVSIDAGATMMLKRSNDDSIEFDQTIYRVGLGGKL